MGVQLGDITKGDVIGIDSVRLYPFCVNHSLLGLSPDLPLYILSSQGFGVFFSLGGFFGGFSVCLFFSFSF